MAPRFLVRSRSNALLQDRAATFLQTHSRYSEIVIIAPTRPAANELALTAFDQGSQGIHALTLRQLAANLAAHPMGRRALAPISRLGIEALAARIVHTAHRANKLPYFSPVALTPGFPRAVARTIAELRLNQVSAADLGPAGAPGADLAHLLDAIRAGTGTEIPCRLANASPTRDRRSAAPPSPFPGVTPCVARSRHRLTSSRKAIGRSRRKISGSVCHCHHR